MTMLKLQKLENNKPLTLFVNNDLLNLFWVGVGSAFSKKLFQTNLLILKGNDHLLIDCGSRCSTAFNQYGLSILNIENYLITHSHSDHIGGLEEVALSNRYITKRKPNMIITPEYQDLLWYDSLKGGCCYNEDPNLNFTDLFNPIRPVLLQNLPFILYEVYIGSIKINLFRTKHIPDSSTSWQDSQISYGIIIDEKIIFTSDTRHDPDQIDYLLGKFMDIQYIFHDCQLFTGGVHCSYQELLTYPINIKQMISLSHYGDNFENFNPQQDNFSGFTQQGYYYII